MPGRSGLTPADAAALSALDAQREQKIESLANRILNSVRPATAARLRAPGRVLASKVRLNFNGVITGSLTMALTTIQPDEHLAAGNPRHERCRIRAPA